MPAAELAQLFASADSTDIQDGMRAYTAYRAVLQRFAEHYGAPLNRTAAAFAALSPNNDYFGNLRSLASVLKVHAAGAPEDTATVSTYKACRSRAFDYLAGRAVFDTPDRELKTHTFYHNILHPDRALGATIDGHMKAAWLGKQMTMRQAIVRSRKEYREIEADVIYLAGQKGLLPHQMQAILWLARKRLLRVKYSAQLDLFTGTGVDYCPLTAPPYGVRTID